MICAQISDLLGFTCYPLNADGSVAMIATPFAFSDGDNLPVYVEKTAGQTRFFDDGGVLAHFLGRGLRFDHASRMRFIHSVAKENGAVLNDDGEIEVWASESDVSLSFAKYMSTLLGLVSWEKEHQGSSQDMYLLIEEVAICLQSWKKGHALTRHPEYVGVSGRTHKLDFSIGGEAISAIAPKARSVSSTLRKMIDITSAPANQGMQTLVVLDDRSDPEAAKAESLVLGAVSDVLMMSKLEALSGCPASIS